MRWLRQFNISSKIIFSYLFLLAAIFLLVIYSIYQLARVKYAATEIEINWLPATRTLGDINKGISEVRIAEYQHVTSATSEEMNHSAQQIQEKINSIQKEQRLYDATIVNDEERAQFESLCQKWADYLMITKKVLALSQTGDKPGALKILKDQSDPLFADINQRIENLINFNEKSGIDTSRRGDSIFTSTSIQIMVFGAFAILTGTVICIFLTYFLLTTITVTRKYTFISAKR